LKITGIPTGTKAHSTLPYERQWVMIGGGKFTDICMSGIPLHLNPDDLMEKYGLMKKLINSRRFFYHPFSATGGLERMLQSMNVLKALLVALLTRGTLSTFFGMLREMAKIKDHKDSQGYGKRKGFQKLKLWYWN
jgi:hypothetical protein